VEPVIDGVSAKEGLRVVAAELDLDPQSLRDTLESAMAIRGGRPQLDCSAEIRTCRVVRPDLPGWTEVIDDSLRIRKDRQTLGPVARVAFSPEPFLQDVGGRTVFVPLRDVFLMHLSHPMLQKALSALTRRRFPGSSESVSRWTVRESRVPDGMDALVLLSVEELAVNNLRESFHHWIRTFIFPIRNGSLGAPLAHRSALDLRDAVVFHNPSPHSSSRNIFDEIEPALRRFLSDHASVLTGDLTSQMKMDGEQARKMEDERYRSRQGEVSSLIAETTIERLEREIQKLQLERQQGLLFEEADRLDQIDRSIEEKQVEIRRRRQHYEEIRDQLERERERILKRLLPNRYTMAGVAQVLPVSIEIRLPRRLS
jgi:hypothetical protein